MRNVKCEIVGHVQKIVYVQNKLKTQCKQLLNSLAIQLQTLNSQNARVFFS